MVVPYDITCGGKACSPCSTVAEPARAGPATEPDIGEGFCGLCGPSGAHDRYHADLWVDFGLWFCLV